MSSSIHPYHSNLGDIPTQHSSQPPQLSAPGGFMHYGNANNTDAASGNGNDVNSAQNTARPPPGATSTQGYAYAAPANQGYPVAGLPGETQALYANNPSAQGGYLSGFPGAQAIVYGDPNAAGYNRPDVAPVGYQPSLQEGQVGAPGNGTGSQLNVPGYSGATQGPSSGHQTSSQDVQGAAPANGTGPFMCSPVYPGSSPLGYQASPQGAQGGAPGYGTGAPVYYQPSFQPLGQQTSLQGVQSSAPVYNYAAPMYIPGYSFSAQMHPGHLQPGDGAQGYLMQAGGAGYPSGAPGASPAVANTVGHSGVGVSYGGVPAVFQGVQGGAPTSTMGGTSGFGYGASAAVYPAPSAGYSENFGSGDYKGVSGSQPPQGYAQPQHSQQQHQTPVNSHDQIEKGRWAAGLCSCCDSCVPNCAMATCCPCVSLAQVYARLGLMTYMVALVVFFCVYVAAFSSNLSPFMVTTTYTTYSYGGYYYEIPVQSVDPGVVKLLMIISIGGQLAFRCFIWRARAMIRNRYNIPGSCCGDCCAVYCCSCCVIAQMSTHLKSYTPGSCTFESPDVLPGYTSS